MCQRLLPALEEGKRYPATEVLLANAIVRAKILHEEDEDPGEEAHDPGDADAPRVGADHAGGLRGVLGGVVLDRAR